MPVRGRTETKKHTLKISCKCAHFPIRHFTEILYLILVDLLRQYDSFIQLYVQYYVINFAISYSLIVLRQQFASTVSIQLYSCTVPVATSQIDQTVQYYGCTTIVDLQLYGYMYQTLASTSRILLYSQQYSCRILQPQIQPCKDLQYRCTTVQLQYHASSCSGRRGLLKIMLFSYRSMGTTQNGAGNARLGQLVVHYDPQTYTPFELSHERGANCLIILILIMQH